MVQFNDGYDAALMAMQESTRFAFLSANYRG